MQEGDLDYESELKQLQQEGEMPLDDLLASLPPGMLEDQPLTPPVTGALSTKDAPEKRETAKDADKGQESSDVTSRRSRKRYLTDCGPLARVLFTDSSIFAAYNQRNRVLC